MAITLYTYNKLCNSGRLSQEIKSTAAIVIGEDRIETTSSPATTKVYMKDPLSPGEESALDALVTAHVNTPLPDDEVKTVHLDVPENTDGRPMLHSTPRKRGTFTCFTGAGDSQVDQSKIGGSDGTLMAMHHAIGSGAIAPIYIDLNTIANETMAHAGWMMWKDALNDLVTLETVPKLSTYEAGTDTYFNLYGGYLIIPAAGNGTITPLTMALVEVPFNEYGVRSGAGYWNATYNTTSKEFENITAAPGGDGQFNMFTVEVVLDRFINRVPMLGTGQMPMDTYDASQIGHNMRMKLSFETRGDDHTWWWCGGLKPYRKRTV